MTSFDNRFAGFPLVIAAAAGMAVMASLFVTGDNWLRSEFDMALANTTQATGGFERSKPNTVLPLAATEDYWLGDVRRNHVTPASWNVDHAVAIGDRISLTINGVAQELEVVSLKTVPAELFDARTGSPGAAALPLLVTLHPVGKEGSPVHLILEGKDDLSRFMRTSDHPHEL